MPWTERKHDIVASGMHGVAINTGIEEFELLPEYIKIQREVGEPIPQATEQFCCQLVEVLANPQIRPVFRNFLKAHLGLIDISINPEERSVTFQPAGYSEIVVSTEQEDLGFDDIEYAAGRVMLKLAQDPYKTDPLCHYGCRIGQPSKKRTLSLVSHPIVKGLISKAVNLEVRVNP